MFFVHLLKNSLNGFISHWVAKNEEMVLKKTKVFLTENLKTGQGMTAEWLEDHPVAMAHSKLLIVPAKHVLHGVCCHKKCSKVLCNLLSAQAGRLEFSCW